MENSLCYMNLPLNRVEELFFSEAVSLALSKDKKYSLPTLQELTIKHTVFTVHNLICDFRTLTDI